MLHATRLLLALATVGAGTLPAQGVPEVCRAASVATVGEWATFNVTGGRGQPKTLRLAIVGSERRGDSTLYWFEIAGRSPADSNSNGIVQMLVPGLGTLAASFRGMIVKLGKQPAMKLSEQTLALMGPRLAQSNAALDFARRCASSQVVGPETVTVPAGAFSTLHVRNADGDAWLSTAVPFAIVKATGTDGTTLLLTGHGTDARSSITETPQEMSLPGMMQKP